MLAAPVSEEFFKRVGEICRARSEPVAVFLRRAASRELASLGLLTEVEGKAFGLSAESWAVISPEMAKPAAENTRKEVKTE